MIRPIANPSGDLIPQAIIACPFSAVARDFRDYIVEEEDDLDGYQGIALALDNRARFAIRHYRGHEPDTVTIYLEPGVRDVSRIRELVARILDELHIPRSAVTWQRGDPLTFPTTAD